jgi:hypothetical protein
MFAVVHGSANAHAAAAEAAPVVLGLLSAALGAWVMRHDPDRSKLLLGWALLFIACMCLLIAVLGLGAVIAE